MPPMGLKFGPAATNASSSNCPKIRQVVAEIGWRNYTGPPLENLTGWGWNSAVHPEDLARFAQDGKWPGQLVNLSRIRHGSRNLMGCIVCFRRACVVEDTWINSWGLCRDDERVRAWLTLSIEKASGSKS